MDIHLNCISPLDPIKPFPKQWEFLSLDCSGTEKTYSHYVGGRGSSKTTTGLVKAFLAVSKWHRGKTGIWVEPTDRLCRDVFLEEWQKLVPSDAYSLKLNPINITMCPALGGGKIHVRSMNADNPNKEVSKGPNYAWGIVDEAAYKFHKDKFWDIDGAIRDGKKGLFLDTLSTPKLNRYKQLCLTEGHRLVKATSFENPHLPKNWAEQKRLQLGPKRFAQEIMGEWTALEGQIWESFVDAEWPDGNRVDIAHDHSRPYYLFFDLGVATSAWLIAQPLGAAQLGYPPFSHNDPLWNVTAEYMPDTRGDASRMLNKIKNEFGKPARVCCGHDLGSRSSTDASTPEYFLANIMGSVPTTTIGSDPFLSDKVIQQDCLSYMINNSKDQRRLVVSSQIQSHDPDDRGILSMMREDTWDEKGKDHLPKEGRLEHVRDACLYGTVGAMRPPTYSIKIAHAA